jgi:hypothetical protein
MLGAIRDSLWLRLKIFGRHVAQSTASCLTVMTGGDFKALTWEHWEIALVTGAAAGLIGVIVSIGPLLRYYGNRWFFALVAFAGTFAADLWSHPSHFGGPMAEALVTAAGAAFVSLLFSTTRFGDILAKLERP